MKGIVSTEKVGIRKIHDPEYSKDKGINYDIPKSMHKAIIVDFLAIPKKRKDSYSYKLVKRLIDIFVSLLVLLLTWPIMLYISFYIKRHSQGEIIFRQTRIKQNRRNTTIPNYYLDSKKNKFMSNRRKCGNLFRISDKERRKRGPGELSYFCLKDKIMKPDRRKIDLLGNPFTFYKVRTMYSDAKERFPELFAYKYTKGEIKSLKFKSENDPRVPGWAKRLRQTSIDELPNFINVLLGDMSLVGPRPDIPEMIKYYTDVQKIKMHVKPGITGLAQIRGRGHLSFRETLKYDIEYVRNRSLMLDLKIIARTILTIFTANGAF